MRVCAVEPSLLPSARCFAAAAAKALLGEASRGRTTAATLHGDLVRCLHGGRGVADAHRALAPRGGGALLAVLDAARGISGVRGGAGGEAAEVLAALVAAVGGEPASLAALYGAGGCALGPGVDAAAAAAVWRVAPGEAALRVPGEYSGLEAAVLQRIAGGADV